MRRSLRRWRRGVNGTKGSCGHHSSDPSESPSCRRLFHFCLHLSWRDLSSTFLFLWPSKTRLSTMAGKSVPFPSAERQAAVGKMVQLYGLPSWFVTVSPGETNNKLVMTISSQPDPCWSEQGIVGDNFKSRTPFKWSVEFDYSKRARRVAENPVAAAKHFGVLANVMMEHLCKLPCHNKRKKAWPGERGALGQVVAPLAALECQCRGLLHFHAVMWSGLTASIRNKRPRSIWSKG